MPNVLIRMSYDGMKYHGWQIQKNALSIQEVFQKALYRIVPERPDIKACSRTDTGVHARDFCVSVKIEKDIEPARLLSAINHYLPADIAVKSCEIVPDDFHARYSCIGKEYQYQIWNHPVRNPFLNGHALHYWYNMDMQLLNRAAQHYKGRHDFTSFCTKDRRETGDLTRTVSKAEVTRDGEMIIFSVAADGFLYNMVRIMVGTLLRVQQGKYDADEITDILSSHDRSRAGPTAPACGLYLNKVFY